jgi:hypothetical protein
VETQEVNRMDKEKEESLLGTITDAAKTSIDAAVEGVSSAASAIAAPSLAQQKAPKAEKTFDHQESCG